jgi:hypothetical protein
MALESDTRTKTNAKRKFFFICYLNEDLKTCNFKQQLSKKYTNTTTTPGIHKKKHKNSQLAAKPPQQLAADLSVKFTV